MAPSDIGLLVLRLSLGVVIMHGLMKLGWVGKGGSVKGVGSWFGGMGMRPGYFWAWVATLAESAGGALTVLGLGGPIGPGIVAADLTVVTIVAHWPKGFWVTNGGWEFTVPIAAGALAVATIGNGALSLDSALGLTYPDWLGSAWVVLMAIGVILPLASRALFAPKPAAQGKTA
jgi:putative oxidoreductase